MRSEAQWCFVITKGLFSGVFTWSLLNAIVFAEEQTESKPVPRAVAASTQITKVSQDEPVPSPDGAKILFQSDVDGPFNLFVMDREGRHISRLTEHSRSDDGAVWSPDGKWIAYSSMDRVSGISEIYLMTADGRSERQLTSDRSFNIHPAWSPDGKRVMYTSTKDSKDRRYDKADNWQTYIIPVNGNGQERLAVEGPVNTYGSWSPDGTKVLLRRKPSSESRISEIYVMNSNGTGLTNLTHNSAYNRYPAWSPDGKLIAFESNLAGHSQILVMNSNGRETRVLANAPGAFSAPRFSSDGRQLFYACELDGEIKVFCVAP